jgi:hypothetical protein
MSKRLYREKNEADGMLSVACPHLNVFHLRWFYRPEQPGAYLEP